MLKILKYIRDDYKIFRLVHPEGIAIFNIFYLPSFKIVILFRLSQLCSATIILKPLAYLITIINDTLHGVWIGPNVEVGKGFFLGHPRGLIVNPNTKIGDYCAIIQQVTLGGANTIIGNNVSINAGAKVISGESKDKSVIIGDNCIIAAGAVVINSMPNNSIVAGMPAKVVKTISDEDNWLMRQHKRNLDRGI
jgi:serine O-acetyltransferase